MSTALKEILLRQWTCFVADLDMDLVIVNFKNSSALCLYERCKLSE